MQKPNNENAKWMDVHATSLKEIVTVDMLPVRQSRVAGERDSFAKSGLQMVYINIV